MKRSKFLVLARLYEDLPNHVSAAIRKHNELLKKAYEQEDIKVGDFTDYYEAFWEEGEIIEVDSYGVRISWEHYARSCRVDGGRYSIPSDALCSDTQDATLQAIVYKKLLKAVERSKKAKDWKETQERAQFEVLKKKFEQTNS